MLEFFYCCVKDFPYDDDPLPGLLADERNLDFPLEKASGLYLQVQVEVAKTMLKCAARGKADLLDFEAVDPYKLLCGKPPNVDEFHKELSGLPEPVLCDEFLEDLIDEHKARIESRKNESQKEGSEWPLQGSARISDIYEKELEFYRTAGPVEFVESEGGGYTWKWRQPANTFWDERRKVYVQELKGVDPNLQLKELRQHMLDITPMRSMCSVGKVRYFRGIVVVGNGKGVYGFGIGFGSTPKECRSDSTLKALQNLDYIDYDPGRMLCTPCRGMEYKHTMKLIPRPIGRGLKVLLAFASFVPLPVPAWLHCVLRMTSADRKLPFYRDDEIVVDSSGIPHFTGAVPALFKENRCVQASVHSPSWHEKEVIIRKTEAFERFFDRSHRRKGQDMAGYIRGKRQNWRDLKDLDDASNMSEDLQAYFLLRGANLSREDRRAILLANKSSYTQAGIETALKISYHDLHEREKSRGFDESRYVGRRKGGKGKGKKFYSNWVDEDEQPFIEEWLDDTVEDEPETQPEYAAEAYAAMEKQKKSYHDQRQKLKNLQKNRGFFRGEFTWEERKKAISKEKERTRCSACHRIGHWAGDPKCPRSGGDASKKN
ncbi:unnamed protein product [Durusdinium trenchii]|uniref:S5 DRBM domain-containing protein n=1 Tax=Durusdinium trenchii TaxID=1381693 RepID=A0ABP0RZA2_9DINO